MKRILFVIITLFFGSPLMSQNVNIPDANFKSYLVGEATINTNGDAEIQVAEAHAFNGFINCPNLGISDLTGIESFIAITFLICHSNNLNTLDLSQNVDLTFVSCAVNALTSIDVSQNLDLEVLQCNNNLLSAVDVSQNINLTSLYCNNNPITSLDLSQNAALIDLYANTMALTSLDLSQNVNLETVLVLENNLTAIDLSQNIALTTLRVQFNQIYTLDLSQNSSLVSLNSNNNPNLYALDLANGNNINLSNPVLLNCPNLSCIEVDDVSYANINFTNKDLATSFSLDCNYCFANQSAISPAICAGEIYTSPNLGTYTSPGMYYDTLVNNCGGDSIIEINLTVNPVDSVQLLGADFCAGETVDFYGTTISNSGTYHQTFTNQNGCDSVVEKTFNELENTIANNNGTLEATQGFDTYQWFESGLSITSANTITFTPTESGNYSCEAVLGNCTTLSNMITVMIDTTGTAIQDLVFSDLKVYPNPSSNVLNISLREALSSIKIFNTVGSKVKEYEASANQIDIADLETGIYLLELTNQTKHAVIRIVKQ